MAGLSVSRLTGVPGLTRTLRLVCVLRLNGVEEPMFRASRGGTVNRGANEAEIGRRELDCAVLVPDHRLVSNFGNDR